MIEHHLGSTLTIGVLLPLESQISILLNNIKEYKNNRGLGQRALLLIKMFKIHFCLDFNVKWVELPTRCDFSDF